MATFLNGAMVTGFEGELQFQLTDESDRELKRWRLLCQLDAYSQISAYEGQLPG